MVKNFKTGLAASVVIFGVSGACQGMEVDRGNLLVPHDFTKDLALTYNYDQQEFTAVLDGQDRTIHKYDVLGVPSNLSREKMEEFLSIGYFSLSKAGEDYTLKATFKLLGGMPQPNRNRQQPRNNGDPVQGAFLGAATVSSGLAGAAMLAPGGPAAAAAGFVAGAGAGFVGGAIGWNMGGSAPLQQPQSRSGRR